VSERSDRVPSRTGSCVHFATPDRDDAFLRTVRVDSLGSRTKTGLPPACPTDYDRQRIGVAGSPPRRSLESSRNRSPPSNTTAFPMANCSRPSRTGRRRPGPGSDRRLDRLERRPPRGTPVTGRRPRGGRRGGRHRFAVHGLRSTGRGFRGGGHPVSARAVARSISTGADRLLTVNPTRRQSASFRADGDGRRRCGSTGRATARRPRGAGLSLPDAGAIDLAETVRDAAGAGETDYFEKTRHSGTDVEISPSDVDVADRDVVVVDDIIATGPR